MIKRLFLLTVASVLFTATTYAAEMKVGIVNVQAVIAQAPQRETMKLAVDETFKERANNLKTLSEEIKAMNDKRQTDRMTMSNEEYTKLSRDIEFKAAELQLKEKALQEDYKAAMDRENNKLLGLIIKAINQVALNEKYDAVVRAETVLFSIPGLDLTDKVVTLMADPSFK